MRLISFFGLFSTTIFAASLSVSPNYFEFEGQPGQSVSEKVTIYNSSSVNQRVKVYTGDFWYDKKFNRTFPEAGTSSYSAASWVSVKVAEIEIPANAQKEIEFVFAIPPEAKPSGYASLFIEQMPGPGQQHGSVGLSLRVAVPLLFRKPGQTFERIGLKDFSMKKPTAFRPLVLSFLLQNDEEQYAFPEGSVLIVKGEKKDLIVKNELKRDKVILPHQRLKMDLPLSIEPKPGNYEGILTLFYGNGSSTVKTFNFHLP
ncbi:MAG: hypothetical protein HYR96_06155 [Deltaproteobacteria bacterium]|nr:hypothetical protein [Deltaproteobacteria bacterium]MBI3295279.1 hypothetical protein [Deltaproteobacteria bacterium]